MFSLQHPAKALPAPLRAAEIPSFTHYSVVTRLPDIARRTLAENKFPQDTVARIQALIDEIPAGQIRPVQVLLAPDQALWEAWLQPYLGMNWLEVPWFFAEEYFYRRILEATGYFAAGDWRGRDPYQYQKKQGLQSSLPLIRNLAEHIAIAHASSPDSSLDMLERLLLIDLWGNQNDLSMWPVQIGGEQSGGDAQLSDESTGLLAAQEHILANALPCMLAWFDRLSANARVDILLDNAGYELVTDLGLADFLLTSRRAARVTLHAKTYPVFVSDATEHDIHDTIDTLFFDPNRDVKEMALRLRSYLLDGRLVLHKHPFWTSPQAMWEMPADLAQEASQTDLMISKGDANYRRLLGDLHWDMRLPFSDVVDYLPCAILALRTLKSEIAVGIDPANVPPNDPDWMTDGKWGMVEFAPPHAAQSAGGEAEH